MNFEFLNFNNYGYFIWPAFIISFLSCLILYVYTKKELRKVESLFFAKFKDLDHKTTKNVVEKKVPSGDLVF